MQEKRVFWQVYYIVTCATPCVSFSSKAINVFPKHILKSKARDQSIQATGIPADFTVPW